MEATKIILELADYMYANPTANQKQVKEFYLKNYSKAKEHYKTIFDEAKKYNKERSEIKKKCHIIKIKKDAENIENRRELILKVYTHIIHEYVKFKNDKTFVPQEVAGQVIIPTVQDVVAAGREICKIEGYYHEINTQINIQQNFITERSPYE